MKKPYIKSVSLFIIPVVLTGMLCSCDSEENYNIDSVKREASLRKISEQKEYKKTLEKEAKLSKFNQAIDILNEYEILDESEMHVDLYTKKYTGTKRAKISHEIRTHAKYVNDGLEEITDYPYLLSLLELKDYVDAAASMGWMLKNIPDTEKLPSKAFDKAIQLLKEAGANVNAKNKDGRTALMCASDSGNVEVVKAFLQAGADVNAKTKDGWTALIGASDKGHIEVVKALLQAGADANVKERYDWTALVHASFGGHEEVVKALLQAGADANAKIEDGRTVLMCALDKGHAEIGKALIAAGADVNAKDKKGWTALMKASRRAEVEIVKALIAAGADVNAKGKGGWTVLYCATKDNYGALREELVKILKEAGAKE
ncbi:MAG: ankyrin repeat domain-containing protein [Akkermansia sp.]|nr:ankyrin repeat domain-containing protein [Akkermansia sp.]